MTSRLGGPIEGAQVHVIDARTRQRVAMAETASDGTYAIRLVAGRYAVVARHERYVTQWYRGKEQVDEADIVPVRRDGSMVAGIDFVLTPINERRGVREAPPGLPTPGATPTATQSTAASGTRLAEP